MKNLTDYEIIESVKKGNTADFALLVERYKNRAFSMLKRMLKNEPEAEEALQDCFLKCFNALSDFRTEAKFSTWFYKITYNTALTRLAGKKRKIEYEMKSLDDELNLTASELGSFEQSDFSEFVLSLIDKLPVKYAAVLNMFYLNGMSCDEIADVTENSIANVKVMLHRARTLLRELIEKRDLKRELL